MKKKLGEFRYYLNEDTGLVLPIPVGYENEYKSSIDEVMNRKYEGISITNSDYLYETIFIAINITKNCNLACKYCFNKNKENKSISYEDCTRFIDMVIEHTPFAEKYVVDLSGSGEPLIELEKILKLVDYCYDKSNQIKKHILIQLVTNGTLLTPSTVEKLQNSNIIFGVSIDGKKKQHDKNRVDMGGNGTFDHIIRNVKAIKHKEYLGAAITINNDNIEILEDAKYLSKYFNTIAIKIMRPEENEILDIDSMKKEYSKLTKYILKEASKGKLTMLKKLINGDDFFGKYIFRVLGNAPVESRCDAGLGKFSLHYDNSIYCCSGAIGIRNLKIGSLDEGIDYELGKKIQISSIQNQTCTICPYRKICGGECLVVQNNSNGVNTQMCELKKHLIELSIYLKGFFLFKYNDLYDELLQFIHEKANRSFADKELVKLSNITDEYTFMELKKLKDDYPEDYKKILNKYISNE